MNKCVLAVLSALLIVVPVAPDARQAVKRHVAEAQKAQPGPQAANPNCALGGTPPAGTSCGISDLTLRPGGALQDTDTMRICPNASGCFGTSTTYQDAQAPLGSYWTPYIRSKVFSSTLAGTVPASAGGTTNFLRADGAWAAPPSSGGGLSGMTAGQVPIAATATTVTSSKPLSNAAATTVATASGTLINGHCVSINGTGDFVDAGGACTTGGGGGTVASGTTPQVAYYAATGTTVSGNANATMLAGGGLAVNRNAAAMPAAVGQEGLAVNYADTDAAAGMQLDGHLNGGLGSNPTLLFRSAGGTGATPSQILAGNGLGSIAWRGYEGTTPGYSAAAVARLTVTAIEPFVTSSGGQGSQMLIQTNPVGSTTMAQQLLIGPGVSVGSPTAPGTAMTTGDLNVQGRILQNGSPYSTGGGGVDTVTGALTAHAGGGQASATALPSQFNVITTVATSGDSVQLPAGSPGIHVIVRNSGVQPLAVFPVNGGTAAINAQAVNTSISVVANTSAYFEAQSATQWFTIP